jgi:mannosyltransferase OCH1-like enzyme
MESWQKNCSDYEIIRWDESNYDISKNRYMREAYETKQWGFVPDYARLDIIYNEGGIYLDTDVELLCSLDRVLNDDMFVGFACNFQINLGSGFGALKHHSFIRELRDYYDNIPFRLENGELNKKTCYEYQHPVFKRHGFLLENSFQEKDGVVLYPSEVFSPEMSGLTKNYTANTISIHHYEYSWASENEKMAWKAFKTKLNN